MRFALTADHREFFLKNHFIELEEILSLEKTASLKQMLEESLAKRLHTSPPKLIQKSPSELYQAGYDLSRESPLLKKTTHKNTFALLASELFQLPFLRYGFDQYIIGIPSSLSPLSTAPLQEISCLSPLAGALLLSLHDLSTPLSSFPFPQKAGHALFFSSTLPIPWPELFTTPDVYFLLIAYAQEKTLFRPNTSDPHASSLKKLGYVFNDFLSDAHHPVLLRKSG